MGKLNEQFELKETYQHDLDDNTRKCKKCRKSVTDLLGESKLCSVIGAEEVANFRDYETR